MRTRPISAWNWTIDRSSQATTHASARRASTTGSAKPCAKNKQSGKGERRGLVIHQIGDLLPFRIHNRRPHNDQESASIPRRSPQKKAVPVGENRLVAKLTTSLQNASPRI